MPVVPLVGAANTPPPEFVLRLPILATLFWPNTFHCTPRSRPAFRVASMKRTSSMTCCGEATSIALMTSEPNCLAIDTALSTVGPSGAVPRQHDAAVDRRHPQTGVGEAAADLGLQQRGVVHHLDVEHADQLLAFGIGGHPRRAVLLAEDRERAVGQRVDVGDLGIADGELDEARLGADVFGLSDIDGHRRRALGLRDLDRPLRLRFAAE